MLNDFNEKCLSRGNIVTTDTLLITINVRALEKIADEGDNLYRSVSDLVLYATGAAACSTSDLLLVLNSINQSLDNTGRRKSIVPGASRRLLMVLSGVGEEIPIWAENNERHT